MTFEDKLKKAHQVYDDAIASAVLEELDRLIATGLSAKEAGLVALSKVSEVARKLNA